MAQFMIDYKIKPLSTHDLRLKQVMKVVTTKSWGIWRRNWYWKKLLRNGDLWTSEDSQGST